MKKQLKLAAAAAILAVTASTSFAADFATSITDMDIDSVHTLASAEMLIGYGTSSAEQNVGLVSQVGDMNIGYINQSTGTGGNFAAIIQDATSAGVANVAYVFQAGSGNRAVVYQH